MDLNIKDICSLLNSDEKSIRSLIEKREIPFYRIHHHYRFNKGEISEWILKRGIKPNRALLKLHSIENPFSVIELIKKGGIYYNVEGGEMKSALKNAVSMIPLPPSIDRNELLSYLLEREEMMPTYVGRGIAVPHPKKPIMADTEGQFMALCFLKDEFTYRGNSDEKLHTFFVIVSSNQSNHLKNLSALSYILQDLEFTEILRRRPSKEEIYYQMEKILMERS